MIDLNLKYGEWKVNCSVIHVQCRMLMYSWDTLKGRSILYIYKKFCESLIIIIIYNQKIVQFLNKNLY